VPADTREHQTRILEFVLRELGPRGDLVVNGLPLPLDWVDVQLVDELGRRTIERATLRYRVMARQESGVSLPSTPPFQEIRIETDSHAPAG